MRKHAARVTSALEKGDVPLSRKYASTALCVFIVRSFHVCTGLKGGLNGGRVGYRGTRDLRGGDHREKYSKGERIRRER